MSGRKKVSQDRLSSCSDFQLPLISQSSPLGNSLKAKEESSSSHQMLLFLQAPRVWVNIWAHFHPCRELITKNPEMWQGTGNSFWPTPLRKCSTLSNNPERTNSCEQPGKQSWKQILPPLSLQWRHPPPLAASRETPKQILDPQKLWDNKCVLKITSLYANIFISILWNGNPSQTL